MTTIPELIIAYWDYLELERRLTAATCVAYVGDVRQLARYLNNKPVDQIERDDIRAYMRQLTKDGKAASTIRRKMHGFSTFWTWLYLEKKVVDQNVTRGLILPRKRRKTPTYLSEEEIKLLISTPAPTARERLAWALYAWCGLRFREVFYIKVQDIRLNTNELMIRESKGDDRIVPIPAALVDSLQAAVDGRNQADRLFAGWSKNKFYDDFNQQLARCGLDGRGYTFRSLRHSFVTHRLDRDTPIHVVKALAGHKRIDTTQEYAHARAASLREGIENSPLGELTK